MKDSRVIAGPWTISDEDLADSCFTTQAPPGNYAVALRSVHKWKRRSDTERHFLVFDILEVLDGVSAEFAPGVKVDLAALVGATIAYFVTKIRRDRRPSLQAAFVSDFRRITGLRPPRDLWRLAPAGLYGESVLQASVRVVEHDTKGEAVPAGARYSIVGHMVRLIDGSPPVLRRRQGVSE